MKKLLPIVLGLILLSGCATEVAYCPPTTPPPVVYVAPTTPSVVVYPYCYGPSYRPMYGRGPYGRGPFGPRPNCPRYR